MKPVEIVARKRALSHWIDRDALVVTVTRVARVRNNAGGINDGQPVLVPNIRGRLTRTPAQRLRGGERNTGIGITELAFDRFVSLADSDLTRVMVPGDKFEANGLHYEVTRVIPYAWKNEAVVEKR